MPEHSPGASGWAATYSLEDGTAAPRIFLFEAHRVWIYDPAKDRWSPGPANSDHGLVSSAVMGDDGLIRVYGCTRCDVFSPGPGSWSAGQQFLTNRCHPVTVAAWCRIYVLGGEYIGDPGRVVESSDAEGG
jgi:hypothetical protein